MNRPTYDGYSDGGVEVGEVLLDNLRQLTRSQAADFELRLLEIRDIAEKMAERISERVGEGLSVLDAISLIPAESVIPTECYAAHETPLTVNVARVADYIASLNRYDRVALCDMLSELLGDDNLKETDFLPPSVAEDSITYVKNPFSDEAYDVFSQDFRLPRVHYSKDLRSCALAASEGKCGYCLLPLEEKGTRLPTVYELILRYDLKINSVIPVFGPDGSADMKYALLSRGFTVSGFIEGDDRYLEIRLDGEGVSALGELCLATEELGMSLYRVNTFNVGESSYLSVVVRDGGKTFTPLLAYLSLFVPDSDFVGLYKNLE